MKCDRCGTEMEPFAQGSSIGCKCPICGWGVISTRSEHPILEDETVYRVYLGNGTTADIDAIRAVAEASGVGFLKAKLMIEHGNELVLEGRAVDIRKKLWALEAVMNVREEPPFPYRPDDPALTYVR